MNKVGIDHIKAAVDFAIALGQGISKATADGFQPLKDLLSLLPTLMELTTIIDTKEDLVDEFNDLDEAERDEIKKYINEKFDIANDRTEAIIEHSAGVVLEVVGLVEALKAPKADGATDQK